MTSPAGPPHPRESRESGGVTLKRFRVAPDPRLSLPPALSGAAAPLFALRQFILAFSLSRLSAPMA